MNQEVGSLSVSPPSRRRLETWWHKDCAGLRNGKSQNEQSPREKKEERLIESKAKKKNLW